MKIVFELPRRTLYIFLVIFLFVVLSISVFLLARPQIALAEWNNGNISTSDSYTLSKIENHLGNLVRELEKLNGNLSDIENEMEKIRYKMN